MRRSAFLSSLALAPLSVAAAPVTAGDRLPGALVLSGGGARGSYEAGVIAAFVEQSGVRDGEPIPGMNVVCGASIGALNGWMVATGQYSRLEQLWKTIGQATLFAPKRRYAAIDNP